MQYLYCHILINLTFSKQEGVRVLHRLLQCVLVYTDPSPPKFMRTTIMSIVQLASCTACMP